MPLTIESLRTKSPAPHDTTVVARGDATRGEHVPNQAHDQVEPATAQSSVKDSNASPHRSVLDTPAARRTSGSEMPESGSLTLHRNVLDLKQLLPHQRGAAYTSASLEAMLRKYRPCSSPAESMQEIYNATYDVGIDFDEESAKAIFEALKFWRLPAFSEGITPKSKDDVFSLTFDGAHLGEAALAMSLWDAIESLPREEQQTAQTMFLAGIVASADQGHEAGPHAPLHRLLSYLSLCFPEEISVPQPLLLRYELLENGLDKHVAELMQQGKSHDDIAASITGCREDLARKDIQHFHQGGLTIDELEQRGNAVADVFKRVAATWGVPWSAPPLPAREFERALFKDDERLFDEARKISPPAPLVVRYGAPVAGMFIGSALGFPGALLGGYAGKHLQRAWYGQPQEFSETAFGIVGLGTGRVMGGRLSMVVGQAVGRIFEAELSKIGDPIKVIKARTTTLLEALGSRLKRNDDAPLLTEWTLLDHDGEDISEDGM